MKEGEVRPLQNSVSRRGFLGTSFVMAGAGTLSRVFEYGAGAAEVSSSSSHPLDSLTASEIEKVVQVLKQDKRVGESTRFVSITAIEPSPQELAGYREGAPFPRRALAILLDRAQEAGFEAEVHLADGSVARFDRLPAGIQPSIMLDEFAEAEEAVKRSPEFKEALKKRGVTNTDLVMVEPWSAGLYGTEVPEDKGKRLMRALCFIRSEATDNGYARPLDGVVVVVDMNKMKVMRIEDFGVVPLPPESSNWAREYVPDMRKDLKPLDVVQPEGTSFTVDGSEVRWQKWRFRFSFTAREGLIIHTVSYNDNGNERPILHRGSICEMVVPYGDPGEQYYRKNAFDIGEYGIGMLANTLTHGGDCLGVPRFFDAPIVDSRGRVLVLKRAICLVEQDYGQLWKHTDWRTNQSETRRSRRLAISFFATVGNYEYGFYWYFQQDGTINCEVKLSGIVHTTSLPPGEEPKYGVMIAPQLNAPFHQHIFAARLIMNVDGPENSVFEVNTSSMPAGPENPHGNGFNVTETLLATEKQAQRHINAASARFWKIINPGKKNRLGKPVAYRLIPGENCPPFVRPDANIMRRAGFASNHVWVTPYKQEERFPAGDYPNQHPTGDGLHRWTVADRNVTNTRIVLWYVFSHNHIPRMEDWPVMPVAHICFYLKPDGFFERNPALDAPIPPNMHTGE